MSEKVKVVLMSEIDFPCPNKFCGALKGQACIDRKSRIMVDKFHPSRRIPKDRSMVFIGELNGWVKRNATTERLAKEYAALPDTSKTLVAAPSEAKPTKE